MFGRTVSGWKNFVVFEQTKDSLYFKEITVACIANHR